MKTLTFIFISIISGAIAGTVLGLVNLGIVEPFLDRAIGIEVQNAIDDGETIDPDQFQSYRIWQKGGQIAAGIILGLSFAALFGIAFVYGRRLLPGSNNQKKALALAGILWLVLFIVPAIKYPANPPTVGDPTTIYDRQNLYIIFILISGLTALSLAIIYNYMKLEPIKKFAVISSIYSVIMIAAFVLIPPNPDKITAPIELVQDFRIASGFSMSIYWLVLGTIFGALWDRFKPHDTQRITTF